MKIIFKTPSGEEYQADLIDDQLRNVRKVDREGGSPRPGDEPAGGQSEQERTDESIKTNSPSTVNKEDMVFIEQLKAVLVNNRARKQLRHKQKGLLDARSFVKTQMDHTSVFRQNNRKDSERNYSVVLLVDESGSMGGEKADLARDLTHSITSSLDKVGGVETAVIGFSGNRVVEHKRFDNTGQSSICCISEMVHNNHHCSAGRQINYVKESDGQNADMIAMEYALNYLNDNALPKSKQIFIMLSDGSPCGSSDSIVVVDADFKRTRFQSKFTQGVENSTDIPSMHRLVKMFPDITSFGLGMMHGGQQVPQHVVVKDIAQTKGVLLNFLRGIIA